MTRTRSEPRRRRWFALGLGAALFGALLLPSAAMAASYGVDTQQTSAPDTTLSSTVLLACNGQLPPLSSDPGCWLTGIELGGQLQPGDTVSATFTNWQDTQSQTVQVPTSNGSPYAVPIGTAEWYEVHYTLITSNAAGCRQVWWSSMTNNLGDTTTWATPSPCPTSSGSGTTPPTVTADVYAQQILTLLQSPGTPPETPALPAMDSTQQAALSTTVPTLTQPPAAAQVGNLPAPPSTPAGLFGSAPDAVPAPDAQVTPGAVVQGDGAAGNDGQAAGDGTAAAAAPAAGDGLAAGSPPAAGDGVARGHGPIAGHGVNSGDGPNGGDGVNAGDGPNGGDGVLP